MKLFGYDINLTSVFMLHFAISEHVSSTRCNQSNCQTCQLKIIEVELQPQCNN